jgi:hypothetical protein
MFFVLAAIAVIGAAGCKSGSGPEDEAGLIGTWRATQAEFVSAANSNTRVDIIAQGSTLTLLLETTNFTLTIDDPGADPNVTTGTWSASKDVLTLTPSGASGNTQFDMTQSGNNLTLRGGHVQFAFDDTSEEAILNMVLVR